MLGEWPGAKVAFVEWLSCTNKGTVATVTRPIHGSRSRSMTIARIVAVDLWVPCFTKIRLQANIRSLYGFLPMLVIVCRRGARWFGRMATARRHFFFPGKRSFFLALFIGDATCVLRFLTV